MEEAEVRSEQMTNPKTSITPEKIQKWSDMVRYGQKWSEMVRNGQKWSEMVRNGHKRSEQITNPKTSITPENN